MASGGKSKESVYVTVETLGVDQAATAMQGLTAPLRDVANRIAELAEYTKTFARAQANTESALAKTQAALAKTQNVYKSVTADQLSVQHAVNSATNAMIAQNEAAVDISASSQAINKVFDKLVPGYHGLSEKVIALTKAQKTAVSQGQTLAQMFGSLLSSIPKTTLVVGGAATAITALGVAAYECVKIYDELNPETETLIDVFDELGLSVKATGLAFTAVAGANINETLLPSLKELSTATGEAITYWTNFMNVLISKDNDKAIESAKERLSGLWATITGTFAETVASVGQTFGIDIKANTTELAEFAYLSKQTADNILAGTDAGKMFTDQMEKAREKLQKTKEEAQKIPKPIRDAHKAVKETKEEVIRLGDIFDGMVFDLSSGDFITEAEQQLLEQTRSYYATLEKMAQDHAERIRLLDEIGDPAAQALKLEEEARYQQQRYDLEYQWAVQTGDMKTQIEMEYQQKRQAMEDEFQAKQQEWLNSFKNSISGELTSALTGMFEQGVEGTLDMRQATYDAFKSLAKNIFNTAISNIVSNVVAWATGAGESQAGIPVVGPILAAAASAAVLATMGIMKAKAGKEAQVQYATGGYVSAGMVKGAYSSGDSVSAFLQPGERVLSKEETKAYDSAKLNQNQIVNINVSINGGFDKNTIQREVRQYLIPEIKRALSQGYNLNPA